MSKKSGWMAAGVVALMALAVTAPRAMAGAMTWSSASQGYWTNAGNWAGGVPGSGDDVFFNSSANGNAIIDGDVTVNSLTANGYTGRIVFTNAAVGNLTINADLSLGSTATLEPQYSSITGNGAGRTITVGGNATIAGAINGNGQGFAMGAGPTFSGASSAHGGLSGGSSLTYGSLTQPTELGGGGRTTSVNNKGGGAIKLVVGGTLTLNGTVSADATADSHAGAAGGSVWLIANTLAGNGRISANGTDSLSNDSNARPGGGGRVAIQYTNSTFTGIVSIAGGSDYDGGLPQHSQPGTLWAPTNFLGAAGSPGSPQAVTITNSFQFFPAATNAVYYWNLTVNGGWLEFHSNALYLSTLLLTNNANLRFDQLHSGLNGMQVLAISNSITLADSTNWLYLPSEGSYNLSGNLYVGANALLYAFGNTGTANGLGVTITAQTVTVNGTINGQGFPNGSGPTYAGTSSGHGGLSGGGSLTYGSLTQPTELGGGGRSGYGPGGGAIKLAVAGTLAVNGAINMNAAPYTFGGGAGGSIWLIANLLTGAGQITASGADDSSSDGNARAGGGGRVAIEYTNSTFAGIVSVAGGTDFKGVSNYGQPGTLWAPKNFLWASGTPGSPQSVTITNSFQFFPSDTSAAYYWNLTVNGGWVEFHSNSLYLSTLVLTNNANLRFDRLRGGLNDMTLLSVTNGITLYDGTNYLYLPSEGYYSLSGSLYVGSNALLYAFGNTGAVNAAAGGTSGNPYGLGVAITAQTITVNGTVAGRGFPSSAGPAPGYNCSGHGGVSGSGSAAYGPVTQPTELGGGGRPTGANFGGGAIKMAAAGALTVNGAVSMDGTGDTFAGGSGGSVWLIANALAGSGQISANATPMSSADSNNRGGGGGRIAIEYASSTFSGSVSAAGAIAASGASYNGKTGTLFQCQSPYPTADSDGYSGAALSTALSVTSNTNGMRFTRTIDQWRSTPNYKAFSWRDTSTDWPSNAVTNVATYTLLGGSPGGKVTIYTNAAVYAVTNYGPSNSLSFSLPLLQTLAVRVEGGAKGTVFLIR